MRRATSLLRLMSSVKPARASKTRIICVWGKRVCGAHGQSLVAC